MQIRLTAFEVNGLHNIVDFSWYFSLQIDIEKRELVLQFQNENCFCKARTSAFNPVDSQCDISRPLHYAEMKVGYGWRLYFMLFTSNSCVNNIDQVLNRVAKFTKY